ncbi:coiled-coil domain-containing protein-domain-containing protein [Mycotypha africana]|uniref:coiled-coil domain-containing protein-domain-containing protein n=1 Tax=Mycotypha africana TaxID=64632 RepID=UPI0023006458|nr:coiled-coil domain-containing protein-domain-containing protein [Mycotypha africana]KAI8991711.1 coiled-coil domain-containing protein-domain-containing protein [Mycotypha africana]
MAYIERNMDIIPYKTLRHGEVDLSTEEKLSNMRSTLRNDPGLFLSKWGKHLSQNTLKLFEIMKNDYEVNFYLDLLLYNHNDNKDIMEDLPRKSAMQVLAHNRRYEYLQRHLRHSDYFSDESIQLREPVLYEEYIGQYVPDKEKYKPFDKEMTLVSRIYNNMDRKYVDDHVQMQKAILDEQFEEEEEDEFEDEKEKENVADESLRSAQSSERLNEAEPQDSMTYNATDNMEEEPMNEEEERERLEKEMEELMLFREEKRNELLRLLEEKFLAGKDKDFRYEQVDYNEDYDDLRQLEEDMQDRYFEEDD